MAKSKDLFTKYELPKKNCTHAICDGEICIVNPVPTLRTILEWKLVSCLHVPVLGGFKRTKRLQKAKRGKRPHMVICYSKRESKEKVVKLWNPADVFKFIQKHSLRLTVDLFSFNVKIDTERTLDKKIWWKKCMVEDVSNWKDLLQIPAVNLVDSEIPVIDDYILRSVFADERTRHCRIKVCCDCTDNCQDKLNCACFQETLKRYNPDERKLFKKDENIGYDYKRLTFAKQNLAGMYECNSKCHCNEQCLNRVAQFPAKWKVQLFKDESIMEKGWGVRTLNDIPEGSFVGVYTGEMSQESKTNLNVDSQDWLTAGKWKYIVNLQVIQNASKEAITIKTEPPVVKPEYQPTISFGRVELAKTFQLPAYLHDSNPNHPTQDELEKRTDGFLAHQASKWEFFRELVVTKREAFQAKKQLILSQLEEEKRGKQKRRNYRYINFTSGKTLYKIPKTADFNLVPVGERKFLFPKSGKSKKKGSSTGPASKKKVTASTPPSTPPFPITITLKLRDVMHDILPYKIKSANKKSDTKFKDDNDENSPVTIKIEPLETNEGNEEVTAAIEESEDNKIEPMEEESTKKPTRGRKAKTTGPIKSTRGKKRLLSQSPDGISTRSVESNSGECLRAKQPRLSNSLSPMRVATADTASPNKGGSGITGSLVKKVPAAGISPRKTQKSEPVAGPSSRMATIEPQQSDVSISPSKKSPSKKSTTVTAANKVKGKYSLRKSTEVKDYTFKQYDDLKFGKRVGSAPPKTKVVKDLYLVDGRKKGNIGRYFNHSCDPNLFCQYVFVDTQDVRFPSVAFFAIRDIKAGSELTWSYNYDDDIDMGIEPVLCRCGADNCRIVLI